MEMKKSVFKKFKTRLDGRITSDDKLIVSGFDNSRNFFYYLTEKALLVLGGRYLGNDYFSISERKTVKVDVLINDLEQLYLSGGEYRSFYGNFIRCVIFPNLTHEMENQDIYSGIIRIRDPPIYLAGINDILANNLLEYNKRRNQKLVSLQEKKCLEVIKEFLLELEPNDEAELGTAIEVVKEESPLSKIDDTFIENALREVAQKLPGFKYIRLTKSIRRKDTSDS